MTIKLYDYVLSGNCYKIRLFLNLLGLDYQSIAIDFYPGREHKSPEFLRINPTGTLPVLQDGDITLSESSAILAYLANTYNKDGQWLPNQDRKSFGLTMQFLAFSTRISQTAAQARVHDMLGVKLNIDRARANAKIVFRELEAHLVEQAFHGQSFLAGKTPTIADIACFPYVALSPDGGIDHDDYPAIRKWLVDIRKLPNFITMPGIHEIHDKSFEELETSKSAALRK